MTFKLANNHSDDNVPSFEEQLEEIARYWYDDNRANGRDKNGTYTIPDYEAVLSDHDADIFLTAFFRDKPAEAADAVLNEYLFSREVDGIYVKPGVLDDYLEKAYKKICFLMEDE